MKRCSICGRSLDQENDPLSIDCGGDCWGCVGKIEAEMGNEASYQKVNAEVEMGLRPTSAGKLLRTPIIPEISAEISFLPTDGGGRKEPLPEGEYRGVFGVSEKEYFSVRFHVDQSGDVAAGRAKEFEVQFLAPEVALPYFHVGKEFTVWEDKIIGHGKVLAVLRDA